MAEGDLKWKYNVGGLIESVIITDSNGVIYCGTGYGVSAANDKIVAVNPDGSLKWAFPGPSPWGFYIIAGLALSNDESVLYAVDAGTNVYALYTTDGTQKWMYGYPNPGEVAEPGISGIVVDANDNIYVGSWCCAEGLFSLDLGGNYRWDLGGDECHSGHAIGKSNTVVYYLDVDLGLREVQLSDGTINWTHKGPHWGCYGTGISIADDGTIYYGDCDVFYAINPDGSNKWSFPLGNYGGINNAIGSNGNIWFGDVNGANSKAIVVNPSGVEVWHYDLPDWIGSGNAATGLELDSNDIVYVGCSDYKLYAINIDGSLRWTYTAGDKITSGIAFSPSEDTVYFGCDDGYLYAIEKEECGKLAVGDKVFLLPIGNFTGNMVALKSGKAATTDKALIAPLDKQAVRKLAFRNCQSSVNDKVVCAPIGNSKKDLLAVR